MEYFDFATPTGTATCEDTECTCPKEPIPAGEGYLYVSNMAVRGRRNGSAATAPPPLLLCRAAVRRRDLNMDIARQDAVHWWETGSVALRATPRRELKFQEFKGTSAADAERQAADALGAELIGTEVVTDVRHGKATAQGATPDQATAAATSRLPADAFDPEPASIIQEGASGELEVTEHDETDAKRAWRQSAPRGATLRSLECVQAPKGGFAGIGRKPGRWVAHWASPYIAEVKYKMPAVVSARFFS